MSVARSNVETGIRAFMRGDRAEAERCWREALRIDPDDERAREYLRSLAGDAPPSRATETAARANPASAWDELPNAGATIELSAGGGIDFSALQPGDSPALLRPAVDPGPLPEDDVDAAVMMRAARAAFALGDFTGSLAHVERVLAAHPTNADALAYLAENEATLVSMYESRLAPLDGLPRMRLRPEEVLWLNLDHRAGFLLAQVDGSVSWEDLFSLSGLSRLDTARILSRLVEDRVIAAR